MDDGNDDIAELEEPEQFGGCGADVILVDAGLELEPFHPVLVVSEVPAHSQHLPPVHILGHPEVHHNEDEEQLHVDEVGGEPDEQALQVEHADHDGLEQDLGDEGAGVKDRLDLAFLVGVLIMRGVPTWHKYWNVCVSWFSARIAV